MMCFLSMLVRLPPRSILFPYTTLFRSDPVLRDMIVVNGNCDFFGSFPNDEHRKLNGLDFLITHGHLYGDRKSTRLNSSHVAISYAVFYLKKKKQKMNAAIAKET